MKKRSFAILFFVLSAICQTVNGQERELVNSGQLLEEGQKLHEEGKYKEAIALYKKISRSDTNYNRALSELSISSYSDSDFIASKKYAQTGLILFPSEAPDWFNLIANALDDLGDKEQALAYYDSSLKKDPNKYVSWYNKGIVLFNQKKYTDARTAFQQCLLINPYYTSAHFFLGRAAEEQGDMVTAILSFTTSLFMDPANKYKSRAIGELDNLAKVNDNILARVNAKKTDPSENFDLQQELLLSKVALDTKYKLATDVEDPITRQLQVLLEKLEYDPNQKGFCMQYYVPFYSKLFADSKYNLLINHIFSEVDIKSIQEYNKKHKKELEDFVAYCVAYFNKIRQTRTLDVASRELVKDYYMFNDGVCNGKGPWRKKGDDIELYGTWEFYHKNGQLKSTGVFSDTKQMREGKWVYYYPSGVLKEISNFSKDSANGSSLMYFDNGIISEDRSFKKDKIEGVQKEYYYNGMLRTVSFYEDGMKTGTMKGYKTTGELDYVAEFKNDKQDGKTTFYYPNGKTSVINWFKNGEVDGLYQKFYEDGSLQTEYRNIKGKTNGPFKMYYPSSKIKEESTYVDDNQEGEVTSYYENGKIKTKAFFLKGKADKKAEEFDEAGRKYDELIYEKGSLRGSKAFDIDGKIISESSLHDGAGTLTFYDEHRKKTNDGLFNKDGLRDGKTTYYFKNGAVNSTAEYKAGMLDGDRVFYYENKTESFRVNYTADKQDGYYTSSYQNGRAKENGWVVEDNKQGSFLSYNIMGDLTSEVYFKNNEMDGYTVYYFPNGKKDYEVLFDEGWIKKISQFDTSGNIFSETVMDKGNGDLVFKHYNGKPYIKTAYRNYYKNGKSENYFFDGTVNAVEYYKQGSRDSIYREYYYGGQLKTEGSYTRGNKEGVWKSFYETGKLNYTETFKNGEEDGKFTNYNEDGSLDKEISYKDGQVEGEYKMYADNAALVLVLNYHNNELQGYTYQNKEGKMAAPVALENGSGMVTAYYPNGQKSAEINFEEGLVNGVRKIYYTNGRIYIDGSRSQGEDNGPKQVFDVNGQLQSDEKYNFDSRQGLIRYYYPNGKIKREENWYSNELNGPCKYYDESGKLTETRNYYYNMLQSVKKQ